jgi:transposase
MTKHKAAGARLKRERRAFTDEYKAEAVRLMLERRAAGASVAHVARELGVRAESLRRWARDQGGAARTPTGETLSEEVRRLRREVAVLRQEQAFAKKVAVYFAKESR